MITADNIKIFMDSGAFSAHAKNTTVDIDAYAEFILENNHLITAYANLDVIGNALGSWKNQRYLEKKYGLNPIPIFHCGESFHWLQRYIDKGYDYIGLGGMVSGLKYSVSTFLNIVWCNYLTDDDGWPKCKVHGFGMTTFKYIFEYPWYSIDSTSWLLAAAMGDIIVPVFKNGAPVYTLQPNKVHMTGRSGGKFAYKAMPPLVQQQYDRYIESKGFTTAQMIEHYRYRERLNAIYYKDLEDNSPKWPWQLKKRLNLMCGVT